MAKKTDDQTNIVSRRLRLSQNFVQPYFDRFLDNYKHYFLRTIDEAVEQDPANYPLFSQIMLPISYQIVETLLPRMFARLPSFSIRTEEENDERNEMALRDLIVYQMNHPYLIDNPIFLRLVNFVKEAFITGNAVGFVPWQKKTAKIKEWQPHSKIMGTKPSWDELERLTKHGLTKPDWSEVEVEKVLIDAPVFEDESIFRFFPDPKKKSIAQMGWCIRKRYATLKELLEEVAISPRDYKNIDELKQMKAWQGSGGTGGTTDYDNEMASIFASEDYSQKDDTQKQFEVLEMREPDKLTIVVNRRLVIRESKNPYRDGKLGVVFLKDVPVPGHFYGWGEVDAIKRIEDMMSDISNLRVEAIIRSLLRMWKVNPNGLVDKDEFVAEPGAIVQVTDMNAIQPLDIADVSGSSYREMSEWLRVLQSVSGVSDYATGQANPSMNKTVGGVELLQQAANARFMFKLQLFENMALKSLGSYYVSRNFQFFNQTQSVVTELGKISITPDQIRSIRGNVHFVVETGSTKALSDQTEVTKWQDILNRVASGQKPFDNLSDESVDKIGQKYLHSIGVTNPEEILKRKEVVENVGLGTQNQQALSQSIPATLAQTDRGISPEGAGLGEIIGTEGIQGVGQVS